MEKTTYKVFSGLLIGLLGMIILGSNEVEQPNRESKVMKRLGTYVGKWKSDIKTNQQNGSEFYFIYHLTYYDPAQNIFKMIITRHFADGREDLMWEGYKGWDFAREEVYYLAFSPSGRFSRGTVYVSGEKLITEYDGYGADGSHVEIVDDFYSVRNDTFESVSKLRPENGDWRVIGRDRWTRM